ncbi:PP2C family protein-serine/threonine phosphatase [Streptomyces sp. HNM0574]|uniref:PP2C family protein-serine/threonine phosphatase n=1 Tax=Streptomyces sp. HNM0574 TaxID=2714954 RepID=UPI00146CA304|nr:PP2C family protein-serine/threonine phosphatase [Streptomyces sp. HNM0574]NLU69646.1 serine/threonine-protein phosphatase [Streptomyces sp. HNM0574]
MSSPHRSKVAGFQPTFPPSSQTPPAVGADRPTGTPSSRSAAAPDELAGWIADLTSLHHLTERLAATATLDDALHEVLRAGASLIGARRGLLALEPLDGAGPEHTVGLGLGRADLGQIETVPRSSASYARLLDGTYGLPHRAAGLAAADGGPPARAPFTRETPPAVTGTTPPVTAPGATTSGTGTVTSASPAGPAPEPASAPSAPAAGGAEAGELPRVEIALPDIAGDERLDPRHREVAARLGYAASYAVPLGAGTEAAPRAGAAVWLYDEPAEPTAAQRHLLTLYLRCAGRHLARHVELARVRDELETLGEELLPSRLPRVPGVALARRRRSGPSGGGDWYDVLPLPEGALGLTVGGVTGGGPSAVAARARLQASLRAYAVMEGEDPVAVLSDLELLLRLTEPARAATALFAYVEPPARRVVIAGAGHCPPLLVGPRRTEFVETTLSAPLGMLACWEAPSVELTLRPEETLLLYSDGLLHRTGEDTDRAFARLRAAAAEAPPAVRADPDALADHVLHAMLPAAACPGTDEDPHPEDVVLLAARF